MQASPSFTIAQIDAMLVDCEEEPSVPGDHDAAYKKVERALKELVDKAESAPAPAPNPSPNPSDGDDDAVPDQHHSKASVEEMVGVDYQRVMPEAAQVGRHRVDAFTMHYALKASSDQVPNASSSFSKCHFL